MGFVKRIFNKFRRESNQENSISPDPQSVFTRIYKENRWKSQDSKSGEGSSLEQTESIRKELPVIIKELGIKRLLDIPCGDFHWMKSITELEYIEYIGGDIVEELIELNKKHESVNRSFVKIDLIKDPLPQADAILVRDCFIHLSLADIIRALSNIKKSGISYIFTTTYLNRSENPDIQTGQWRPLNLQKKPFSLPEPLKLIDENCSLGDGQYSDKRLGVWDLSKIDNI